MLHYEAKYFLGFGITELLIGTFAGLFGMMAVGTPGLLIGVVVLLGVRRFDGLGNRSILEYGVARLMYEMRREEVVLPRVCRTAAGASKCDRGMATCFTRWKVRNKGDRPDPSL